MSTPTVALSTKNTVWHGWTMAFFSILFLSVGPAAAKFVIIEGVDLSTLIALRYVGSTLLLVSTIALTAPSRLQIDRKGLFICITAGLIFGSAFFVFISSLARINASIASMLVALYPLIVLTILAFRGEKFTSRNIIRLILGLLGIYFLIGLGGPVDLIGVIMALVTSVAYAVYLVIIQTLKDYDGQTVMLYVFSAIAVFAVILWLVVHEDTGWQWPTMQAWLGIGVLVIFTSYLAQLSLFAAIRHIGSGQMALLSPLEVLLTVIWSVLVLQEYLTPMQWIGGGLILSSMLLAMKRLRRAHKISWRSRLRMRL